MTYVTLTRAKAATSRLWQRLNPGGVSVKPTAIKAQWATPVCVERLGSRTQPPRRYREATVTLQVGLATATKAVTLYEDGEVEVR